jgi:hypothetical protein
MNVGRLIEKSNSRWAVSLGLKLGTGFLFELSERIALNIVSCRNRMGVSAHEHSFMRYRMSDRNIRERNVSFVRATKCGHPLRCEDTKDFSSTTFALRGSTRSSTCRLQARMSPRSCEVTKRTHCDLPPILIGCGLRQQPDLGHLTAAPTATAAGGADPLKGQRSVGVRRDRRWQVDYLRVSVA